ncbi:MAG: response regulator, partial [Crocinitomicaceae bacterium]|nr:response regulator [Crocinitomicaceae bacterium]
AGARILIVDDDAINRRVLCNLLNSSNFELVEASHGQQAIDIVRNSKRFDLILLDIMMPKISGYHVCVELRKKHSIHDLPIIFLTAKSQSEDLVKCFKMGGNDFLTKPVDKLELIQRVYLHLEVLRADRVHKLKIIKKNQNLATIAYIGRLITSGFDMQGMMLILYKNIKLLMPVDIFRIGIYNKDREEIEYTFGIQGETQFMPCKTSMRNDWQLPVWCIANDKDIFINDVNVDTANYLSDYQFEGEDHQLVDGTKPLVPSSMLYLPITAGDDILGVLTVQCLKQNQFLAEHLDLLQSIVSFTAIAVKNTNTHDKLLLAEVQRAGDAELASKTKTQFLATMSHELRTPMNGVIGIADLLQETPLNKQQSSYVDIIRRSGCSLIEIINDILDFSKIESGKIELEAIEFDLENIVEDCVQLFSEAASRTKIELLSGMLPGVNLSLIGDPTRLKQILINLIGNAFKFTKQGFVSVTVSVPEIEMPEEEMPEIEMPEAGVPESGMHASNSETVTLKFSVTDSGIGISDKVKSKLFKSYIQAELDTNRKYGGTGLGLAICKELSILMGGSIGIDSAVGVGSTFWFTVVLPISKVKKISSEIEQEQIIHESLMRKKMLFLT